MKLNIYLNDNRQITVDNESFNAAEVESSLNNPKLLMLVVGNLVINKNTISAMGPEVSDPTALITLHNGVVIPTDVVNFSALEIAEKMNQQMMITAIGQIVLNKNIVRMVEPVVATQ